MLAGPIAIIGDGILEIIQPRLMAKIVDDGIQAQGNRRCPAYGSHLHTGGWMIILALLAIVFGILGVYFTANGTFRFGASLRQALFHKVQTYSFPEH